MEDSFRVRVDRVFGSLEASSSSSIPNNINMNTSSSLWCLTDDEIERREWNRDKDSSPEPDNHHHHHFLPKSKPSYQSFIDALFPSSSSSNSHIQELDDESEEEDDANEKQPVGLASSCSSSRQLVKPPDDHNHEEWDIGSSLGLDSTLDFEEEEDAYDKVAIGTGEAHDRFYMSEINDYEVDIDSNSELPTSFRDVTRDPRANHMAAKIRLKEDAEAAGDFASMQFSSVPTPSINTQNSKEEDRIDLKSILKVKDSQMTTDSEKRVRFEPGCENQSEQGIVQSKSLAMEASSSLAENSSSVPDYIRNRSNYTHFIFDSSSDNEEESNQKAYMDFLNSLKGSSNTMETDNDVSEDFPRSVTFIPKKNLGDSSMKNENDLKKSQEDRWKESMHKKGRIAAGNPQDSEVCAMEEDEPETATDTSSSLHKAGRRYRTKGTADLDEY